MKQLLQDTLKLAKDLALLRGPRELYVLLALKGLGGFVAGLIVASLL